MHEDIVLWFSKNQRALPWRIAYDPYHVWVCEVMLQQTQVETALPYYERFLNRLPTIHALAEADEQEVLTLWAGLGYYSRARNLQAAAKIVARDYDGIVPDDYETLRSLPGIGQYMAGAIMSIAFNKPFPIVDGNVRRVLSRVYGWTGENAKHLWEAAERLVRQEEPRAINQALMELGATVCSFKSPRCLLCPLKEICVAFRTGSQDQIPVVKKRPETIRVLLFAVVQHNNGRYLMRKEKGLWEFPMFGDLPSGSLTQTGSCRHTITHHRLEVNVYSGTLEKLDGFEWKEFNSVPVSSLTRKIFTAIKIPLLKGEGVPKGRVRGTAKTL
jgi:A/G-specific adenine glycosylase